jgi:hypothetical protein
MPLGWAATAREVEPTSYICGFCEAGVAVRYAYCQERSGDSANSAVCICPLCGTPTWLTWWDGTIRHQVPKPAAGRPLGERVPTDVRSTYNEARVAHSAGAFTAAAMMCRKLLMSLAVAEGDKPGRHFVEYIDWLAANGHTPPKSTRWVTAIKDQGNLANHEVRRFSEEESTQLLEAAYALIFFNYEIADDE